MDNQNNFPAVAVHEEFKLTLAHSTGYLLQKAGALLIQDAEKALKPHGLRLRYYYVLAVLGDNDRLSQQDLARVLNLDPTTVVVLIDEMEQNAHVERRRNPRDRRRYILHLSDAGRQILETTSQAVEAVERGFLSGLPAEDCIRLNAILGRALANRWPSVIACD
jgi:MarR family transcriptional regulator, lower aerobic nicotinate degradation pathway regulator